MYIDITRLTGRLIKRRLPTGVDRVDIEYLHYFKDRANALIRYKERWLFFSHEDSLKLFEMLINHDYRSLWQIRKMGFLYFFLSKNPLPNRFLLNISHSGLDQEQYGNNLVKYKLKPIFFLHDLIPIQYPEYSRPDEERKHRIRVETMLRYGKGIIVNSHYTLDVLKSYAYSQSLKIPESIVTHLATVPLSLYDNVTSLVGKDYFVMLGTIEPRKNHWMILHVWRELVKKMGVNTPTLVIIGQHGWECENVVDMLERCNTIHPYVVEKKRCSDEELVSYLKHARALLGPSFVEGYGLPLIEALAIGVPVIASNLEVFREIANDIPEYLDPIDGKAWIDMIIEYIGPESTKRLAQIDRIEHFVLPTWENHFNLVEKFLEMLG